MNKSFSEELFLSSQAGRRLYRSYGAGLPIVDIHSHLSPGEIYENKVFEDLGELWLAHDHYKWRAMRAFGIEEKYITGQASYRDKFMAFAGILPRLAGNPLYIWCALELKRYFGIEQPLSAENAAAVYQQTKEAIWQRPLTPRVCLEQAGVELVCTTDDPADSLEYHRKLRAAKDFSVQVLPTFRPDSALYCEMAGFGAYVERLGQAAEIEIESFVELVAALEKRLLFFKEAGARISDCGLTELVWRDYTEKEIEDIFAKAAKGQGLEAEEIQAYRSAFLLEMGRLYRKHGFVMQLHVGTYSGANRRGERLAGAASGFDCMDDSTAVKSLGALLDRLTRESALPRVILYPLNPAQLEPFAVLAGAFCGEAAGAWVRLGAPWWFNDRPYGIRQQFQAEAGLSSLALSPGMVSDSRCFLSYSRYEIYRRLLCNYLGELVESGEYFSGEEQLAQLIEDVCHRNARRLFD